jgi:NAD+ kinase
MTPLAPHGGVCPPLVAGPESRFEIRFDPGNGGARIELDGQVHGELEPRSPATLTVGLEESAAVLVSLGEHEPLIAGLRRRRIILDSPRVLARDEREGKREGEGEAAPERPPEPAQRTR